MEILLGLIVCIVIVIVAVRIISAGATDRDNKARYLQQLDASQAWVKQRTDSYQQIEMICGPIPLGFDSDESVIFVLPGVRLLEPRAIRRSRSSYGGPTIRLAKGLSFRLGSGASQSESSDELRNIDEGTWVLTTKRLAFLGSLRTSNVKLDDIISIQAFADGVQIHRERKERAETYVLGQTLQITEGSGQGMTVFGPMIMVAIQVAKVFHENPAAALALTQQQPDTVKPIHREYRPGASPLQYGSLYEK
jgi:hypothetical protein